MTRAYLNHEVKERIGLPNEGTCTDAISVLESGFQVSQMIVNPKLLLPKVKNHAPLKNIST